MRESIQSFIITYDVSCRFLHRFPLSNWGSTLLFLVCSEVLLGVDRSFCQMIDHLVKVLFSLSITYLLFSSSNLYYYSWKILVLLLQFSLYLYWWAYSCKEKFSLLFIYSFIRSFICLPTYLFIIKMDSWIPIFFKFSVFVFQYCLYFSA